MKHGIAFRKLSRTMSHRNLMLRNLVTSLFEHEQIKTTVAKAKEASRLAEKMITLAKRGTHQARVQARAFYLKESIVTNLFSTLVKRYNLRPGGYTRIHKLGNRKGDNAPQAVLELVDCPQDLRLAITARALGWELLCKQLKARDPLPHADPRSSITAAISSQKSTVFRPLTSSNIRKVVRFNTQEKMNQLVTLSNDYMNRIMADPEAHPNLRRIIDGGVTHDPDLNVLSRPTARLPAIRAGQRLLEDVSGKDGRRQSGGWSSVRMSKGDLSKPLGLRRQYIPRPKLGVSTLVMD